MQANPMDAKKRPKVKALSPKECISGSSEKLTLSTSSAPQMIAPLAFNRQSPTTSLHQQPDQAVYTYKTRWDCLPSARELGLGRLHEVRESTKLSVECRQ